MQPALPSHTRARLCDRSGGYGDDRWFAGEWNFWCDPCRCVPETPSSRTTMATRAPPCRLIAETPASRAIRASHESLAQPGHPDPNTAPRHASAGRLSHPCCLKAEPPASRATSTSKETLAQSAHPNPNIAPHHASAGRLSHPCRLKAVPPASCATTISHEPLTSPPIPSPISHPTTPASGAPTIPAPNPAFRLDDIEHQTCLSSPHIKGCKHAPMRVNPPQMTPPRRGARAVEWGGLENR